MSVFSNFIKFNRNLYNKIARYFPQTSFNIWQYYHQQVKQNIADKYKILDIGGGKNCSFAGERKNFDDITIIALDVSEEELQYNHDVDLKIINDITSGQPIPEIENTSIDLVTSSSVLEHLKNLEAAVTEISRVLKPGGKFISLLPNKFALSLTGKKTPTSSSGR